MNSILVIAGREWPCPEEIDGVALIHYWPGIPDSAPRDCKAVVCIPKMCGHDTHHRARRQAKGWGLPFTVATSVSCLRRRVVELGLARSAKEINQDSTKRLVGAAVKEMVDLFARVPLEPAYRPEAPPPSMFIPTDADDLTDSMEGKEEPASVPEPIQEPTPSEEKPVTDKEKNALDRYHDYLVMALSGLDSGPYETYRDIWKEAKKFQEFTVQKGDRAGKPMKPNSFSHVITAAMKRGVVKGSKGEGWTITHDASAKLTPISSNGHVQEPEDFAPAKIAVMVRESGRSKGEGLFTDEEWSLLTTAAISEHMDLKPAMLKNVISGFRQDFLAEVVRRYILKLAGIKAS
jgi:hypothetical protein